MLYDPPPDISLNHTPAGVMAEGLQAPVFGIWGNTPCEWAQPDVFIFSFLNLMLGASD